MKTKLIIIYFLSLAFFQCKSQKADSVKFVPNPKAKAYLIEAREVYFRNLNNINSQNLPSNYQFDLNEEEETLDNQNEIDAPSKLYLDTCISLLDSALQIDSLFYELHSQKKQYLFENKDLDGLFKMADKTIVLFPNDPEQLIFKGLLFELKDNDKKAKELYKKALDMYKHLLKTDSGKDVNFRINYIFNLRTMGYDKESKFELEKLFNEYPNDNMVIALFENFEEIENPKEQLFKEWNK